MLDKRKKEVSPNPYGTEQVRINQDKTKDKLNGQKMNLKKEGSYAEIPVSKNNEQMYYSNYVNMDNEILNNQKRLNAYENEKINFSKINHPLGVDNFSNLDKDYQDRERDYSSSATTSNSQKLNEFQKLKNKDKSISKPIVPSSQFKKYENDMLTPENENFEANFNTHHKANSGLLQKGGIKKGDYIRVKVVNYNPFLYKVSVDNRDSSVSQPIDAGFLGMFLSPDKFSGAVAGLISTVGVAPPSVPKPKPGVGILTDFEKTVPVNKKETDSYKVSSILENYIKHTDSTKNEIIALRKKIEEIFSAISAEYATLQKLYLDCNSLSLSAIQTKADSYSNSLKSYLKETYTF